MEKIKWGILGTGKIAKKFAQGLATLSDAELYAVGSRSITTANAFADEYQVSNAHASYEALAQNPEVEVIYVATPHPYHVANATMCLEAGKAVLCEKPLTVNAYETQQMINSAKKHNLFLMEAMWTRFMPAIVAIRKMLLEGKIGKVTKLIADFSFNAPFAPEKRTYNPHLGGGALLDIGIYPISFAYMIFGRTPIHASSFAHIGETGVDYQSSYLFGYDRGEIASLNASFSSDFKKDAYIIGTEGMIHIPLFWKADSFTLYKHEQDSQTFHFPYEATGLQFQAVEVMKCLREGKKESDIMSLNESLRIMQMMDRMREEWGLKYPMEK